jgi:hypothetical protein
MNKLLFLILILISCKEEKQLPKVIYNETKEKEIEKIDTSTIKIADLPILMEGTDYLLHPVGELRVYGGKSKISFESTRNEGEYVSYNVSNYNQYELTGNLKNILFQHKDQDTLKPLTDQKINIETATYLHKIAQKNKIFVYTLFDKDTNKDGFIDQNDIKALYISKIDGTNFKKITLEFQELIDWNLIQNTNRLYYRAMEDTNKNGEFDKNDTIHYCYLDLSDPNFKIKEYFPIQ